jgi:hypothetical protein
MSAGGDAPSTAQLAAQIDVALRGALGILDEDERGEWELGEELRAALVALDQLLTEAGR